jgi:hypothetical protein
VISTGAVGEPLMYPANPDVSEGCTTTFAGMLTVAGRVRR